MTNTSKRSRLRPIAFISATVFALVAAYAFVDGLIDDTSAPAKYMAAKKSRSTLISDCRNNVRVSCYELARKIDKAGSNVSRSGKSVYSKDEAETIKFGYSRACGLKYRDACVNLYLNYQFPSFLNDLPKAMEFAIKGCQLGDRGSCGEIGRLKSLAAEMPCIKANDFLNTNPSQDGEAEKFANLLPSHDLCIYVLGVVNDHRSNFTASAKYFRAAAAFGDPYAMRQLGSQYEAGHGVVRSYPEALNWYHKALNAMNGPEYKGFDNQYVALIKSNIEHAQIHKRSEGK